MFEELGVLKEGQWDERALCFEPQERLYIHGRWQEGIEPEADSTNRDREDYRRFQARMTEFRGVGRVHDSDGARRKGRETEARSSIPCRLRSGCGTTNSHRPIWSGMSNYACRDDYGALARDTSAPGLGFTILRRARRRKRDR